MEDISGKSEGSEKAQDIFIKWGMKLTALLPTLIILNWYFFLSNNEFKLMYFLL